MKALFTVLIIVLPGVAHADAVDCFQQALTMRQLNTETSLQLCHGAKDTTPVLCFTRAIAITQLTNDAAIQLCQPVR